MFYAGIDIGKFSHTLAVSNSEGEIVQEPWSFNNDAAGFAALNECLARFEPNLRIGFEATGHYAGNLMLFLERNGREFMEFQPLLVEKYKESKTLRGTKTDPMDARWLAWYLLDLKPREYRPHPKNFYRCESLRGLTRLHSTLVHERSNCLTQLTNVTDKTFPEFKPLFDGRFTVTALYILENYGSAEKIARMHNATFETLRKLSRGRFSADKFAKLKLAAKNTVGESNEYLQIQLQHWLELYHHLDGQIDMLAAQIKSFVTELDPPCKSIPGIGHQTAAVIVTEFGSFESFRSPDAMLAFIGLDCGQHKSGQQQKDGGHMVKHGSKYLREALMNVIMPLCLHNPTFAAYYRKKRAEGKDDDCAKAHTVKKLLRVIFALEQSGEKWDTAKAR